jgi:hypothetical protein
MNSRLEACTTCTQQCTLEQKSATFVVKTKDQSLTFQQIREGVSKISQSAFQQGCPPSEISRIRQEINDKINPSRSNIERATLKSFGIKDSTGVPFYEVRSNRT